jgi:tRNA dimethylallyltransferase
VLYFKAFYSGLFVGPSADAVLRSELRARAALEGTHALHAELARIDPPAASRIHANDLRRIERALEVYRLTGRPISALQREWEDPARRRRPEWDWRLIGLRYPREIAGRRINERVRRMIAAGLLDEVRRLWSDARGLSEQARQAVGYRELIGHLEGRCSLDEAIEQVKIDSRRLAKQQRTWLKRLPDVTWFECESDVDAAALLNRIASADFGHAAPLRCRFSASSQGG